MTSPRNTIYSAAVIVYGKREHKNANWFNASITVTESVVAAKRAVLTNKLRLTIAKFSRCQCFYLDEVPSRHFAARFVLKGVSYTETMVAVKFK